MSEPFHHPEFAGPRTTAEMTAHVSAVRSQVRAAVFLFGALQDWEIAALSADERQQLAATMHDQAHRLAQVTA